MYISCLNQKDTFIVKRKNQYLDYLNFCIKSKGDFKIPLFEIKFYREFIGKEEKSSLNYLADKLFYKNYDNFFHYYDFEKVKFYREILRYKIARYFVKNKQFSIALKILDELEKSKDFRLKFISLNLRNQIYQELRYKTKVVDILVPLNDGIYSKGIDSIPRYEKLKVYKYNLICELDFPEIYIVKDGKLLFWDSPIIH